MNLDKTDRESQRGYPCEAGNALLRLKKKMLHGACICTQPKFFGRN